MSHSLKAITDEIGFAAGACVFPVPLVPGALYRLTGFTQGTLGAYDITAKAVSTTEFATTVEVFPAGDAGYQYWGTFDFTACQLEFVRDRFNNNVTGNANVSVFPWFNGLSVYGNSVEDISSFIPNYVSAFSNNSISGASTLDMSLATGISNFDTVTLSGASSYIVTGSAVNNVIASDFSSGSSVTVNGAGTLNLTGVSATGGSAISATALGTTSVNNSTLQNESTLTIAGTGTITRLFANRGTLATTGGTKTDAVVETGTLTSAAFTVTRVRLEDASSTLIANATDATKTGYVNALP